MKKTPRIHCRPSWTIAQRLAYYTKVDPISGCRLWLGALSNDGYGALTLKGHTHRAHRLAWSLAHGPIPPRTDVCHRCDERRCVNPEHLFLDSHAANMADSGRKERARRKLAFADHRARDDVATIRLYYRGMQMKGELTVEPFDAAAVLATRVGGGRARSGAPNGVRRPACRSTSVRERRSRDGRPSGSRARRRCRIGRTAP